MTLDLFGEPAERGLTDGGVTHGCTGAWSPPLNQRDCATDSKDG